MSIQYMEIHGQKLPIEDGELREVVPKIEEDVALLKGSVGFGIKQLLPYPFYYTTRTDKGIEWTDNGDGTLTLNGTAESGGAFQIQHRLSKPLRLQKGRYILNGVPMGSGCTIYVSKTVAEASQILATDNGNGAEFILDEATDIGVYAVVSTGVTVVNLLIKPMIRYASIEDDTFESYVSNVHKNVYEWHELTFTPRENVVPSTNTKFYQNGDMFKCSMNITINQTLDVNGYMVLGTINHTARTKQHYVVIPIMVCNSGGSPIGMGIISVNNNTNLVLKTDVALTSGCFIRGGDMFIL